MSRPTFFVDRCLGKRVGQALRQRSVSVVLQSETEYTDDTEDEVWIPGVTQRGWVILTKDKNIRRAGHERDVVLGHGARVFTLTSGCLNAATMCDIFVRHIPVIEQVATSTPAPFVAIVDDQLGVRVLTHIGTPAGYPPTTPATQPEPEPTTE